MKLKTIALRAKLAGFAALWLAAAVLVLAACHRNSEPPADNRLYINEQYLPGTVIFSETDTEFKDKCREWIGKTVVVNSPDQLPADPLGFNETFRKINFSYQTLLIYYLIHDYEILSLQNLWVRNYLDDSFDWTISLGITGETPDLRFTRFSILVPKLPADADVRVLIGVSSKGSDWSE